MILSAGLMTALGGSSNQPIKGELPAITAIIYPQSSLVEEGQAIADMIGFASMTRAENFETTAVGASIDQIVVTATGDATDIQAALLEGQNVGFEVVVSDSASHTRAFKTALQVVVGSVLPVLDWVYVPQSFGVEIQEWPIPDPVALVFSGVDIYHVILEL